MDQFRNEAAADISVITASLDAKERTSFSDIALHRLALLVQNAFEDLAAHPEGVLYDLPALYSKAKNHESAGKIKILAELFKNSFYETMENIRISTFWQLYAEDLTTPRETQHAAAVLLYGLAFAFSRFVQCPDSWWYKTEDQHLPLLNSIATMVSEENQQLRAMLIGTYALLSPLIFDGARHTCTFGEASIMVDGHLTRAEAYFATFKNGLSDNSLAARTKPLEMIPLSLVSEVRFLVEFLSSFESYPHIRNDPIKKMLEKNMLRIHDIAQLTLEFWDHVDHGIGVPVMKLTANMIKAYPVFAKTFSENPASWKLLLSLPLQSRVAVHVSHCLTDLLAPRFWCTGDPVGATFVLSDYLDCLETLRKTDISEHAVSHLRSANAIEIFEGVLGDRRAFDPFRVRGKEEAVEKCYMLKRAIQLTICGILSSMARAPSCRQFLVNGSFFNSTKILGNLRQPDGNLEPEAEKFFREIYQLSTPDVNISQFLANLLLENSTNMSHLPDAALGHSLQQRLVRETFSSDYWLTSEKNLRRMDCRYSFQKSRKVAVIPVRQNTGDVVTATFVGASHEKVMLRTSMGHLMCTDVRSQKMLYAVHDWTHNDEDYIRSLPSDPMKFLNTSTDLVTDTDPKKSHLWSLAGRGEKCHAIAEYNNFQFMRPSGLDTSLAVGHAPIWRRKHGCYFTLDMETKHHVTLLGPLYEEENHPNFPSFHPNASMVIFMGSIWDYRSGDLVHRFDRIKTKNQNCVENLFHADGAAVLIDDQVWDLRTFALLRKINRLKDGNLQFSSSGDVLIGRKLVEAGFDDMTFYDPTNYSTIAQVPINGLISDITIDRMDYRIVVCRRNGLPLLLEVGTKYPGDPDLHPDFMDF